MLPGILNSDSLSLGIIIFLLCFVGIPALSVWLTRTELTGYGLPGNGFIVYAAKPSRAEVIAFLQALHTAKVQYILRMYIADHEPQSTPDGLRRLAWLKELGVLTDADYQAQQQAVMARSEGRPIGF